MRVTKLSHSHPDRVQASQLGAAGRSIWRKVDGESASGEAIGMVDVPQALAMEFGGGIMQDMKKRGVLTGLCGLALAMGLTVSVAQAQEASPATEANPAGGVAAQPQKPVVKKKKAHKATKRKLAEKTGERYFIEFRSRYALTYGHTFLAHGRLNARGEIVESEVAGLHPAGAGPELWTVGHILPVPSETGPSDGDLEEQYISARYRIDLDEARYKEIVAFIRQLQASSPVWHAALYNCNRFVGVVAEHMGLRAPNSIQNPQDFINSLRELNTKQQHADARASLTSAQ
jgi:hypothetical protein